MVTAPKRNALNRDMDPISVPFWMIKTLPYTVLFRVHVPNDASEGARSREEKIEGGSRGVQVASYLSCTCMLLVVLATWPKQTCQSWMYFPRTRGGTICYFGIILWEPRSLAIRTPNPLCPRLLISS